jgi:arylformamidase
MQIYDISVPLVTGLPGYPGDPPVVVESVLTLAAGDGAQVARLTLADHSGTHIDAPSHMLADGAPVDGVPLAALIGPVLVADLRGVAMVGARELAELPLAGVQRLLLKTDNSRLWNLPDFYPDYVALSEDGAQFLLRAGIRLVGIDYLSIERFGGDGAVHRLLLGDGVVILEGLDLSAITAGCYELLCLPLRLAGGGGAPARAVLRGLA